MRLASNFLYFQTETQVPISVNVVVNTILYPKINKKKDSEVNNIDGIIS